MYSPVTWGFSFLFKEDIHQKSLYPQVRPQTTKEEKKKKKPYPGGSSESKQSIIHQIILRLCK